MLKDANGNCVQDVQGIKNLALDFYQKFICSSSYFSFAKARRVAGLIKRKFSANCIAGMNAPVTRAEITKVMFAMNKHKAPSPDGFSASIFHKAWPIVGGDVCDVVLKFFNSSLLLKKANSTILTLVPKKKSPSSMGDYRPISCCNVVYKCITEIIANRMIPGLDDVIRAHQGAFIPGRGIAANILLAKEVVNDYHKERGKPRCTLKVDLMKAYESLSWEYILFCLHCFGAPPKYISWIRECITSPSFSIALNGSLVGYFHGKKGLRQRDQFSPYLFVLAMEGLSLLLEEIAHSHLFAFHPICNLIRLHHLCFADYLLIFSEGSIDSVQAILAALNEFEELSGLKANPSKSSIS
jgi:hypothetical protein